MLPEKFLRWAYGKRANLVKKQVNGENIDRRDIFLGFTTHTPVVITYGRAGLNGSVKGVGFIPKKEYIEQVLEEYMAHISTADEPDYSHRGLKILYNLIWSDNAKEKIDFSILGTLELAKLHTWTNLQDTQTATLLFYEPPATSFEVRCSAEIHTDGIYHKYLNAQHDMYHHPNPESWANRPAYIFRINEIYDNSVGKGGFGTLIFP